VKGELEHILFFFIFFYINKSYTIKNKLRPQEA
jgi:hypothetical protein